MWAVVQIMVKSNHNSYFYEEAKFPPILVNLDLCTEISQIPRDPHNT
jgi:hypothetical protein